DVADLVGQVGGHQVHVVGQVLPDPGDAFHLCLAPQLALGTHLARNPRDLGGEGVELVDHDVDRVLKGVDLSSALAPHLPGKTPFAYAPRFLSDVADLVGQVGGHQVHAVGQVGPGAADAAHVGLAAQLALGPHLAGDARHLRGESVELVD